MTANTRDSSLQPLTVYPLNDPPLTTEPEPFDDPNDYNPNTPIALDFGSYEVRAGFTSQDTPSHVFPTKIVRYKERKIQKALTFIGNDCSLDNAVRSHSRSPYDGSLITNWEYMEDMLSYTFHHLGVQPNDGISNPMILTEKMATVQAQRSNWYQLLFECYGIPQVTFGIDGLFSFYANNSPDSTGLIINSGHEDTNIIPVIKGKGILSEAKRIDWGGNQSIDYLKSLLSLKYPYFPSKLTDYHFQSMYQNHCYFAKNYEEEVSDMFKLDVLENKDIVLEAPFTEVIQPQKTEEELRIQAEKRRETGKRLQEQAKQRRLEKLRQKEEEYEYYVNIREELRDQPKRQILITLQNAGFDDEQDFINYISNLEKVLKRGRILDVEDDDQEESQESKFDLVDVPDEELNDEQKKEKRKQRLLKANIEARLKAKEEKAQLQKALEEAKKKDEDWRKQDLKGWTRDKRFKLAKLIKSRKDKLKLKEEMKDRKSQATQRRMKNLASLAEDSVGPGKRSRQATIDNDPSDTFGANDDDWTIYNDIAITPEALDESIEDEYREIVELEKSLLEFDPSFTEEDTLDAQYDWRNSVLHLFLRGPRPHNGEDVHQQHQLHLNIERIRAPEVIFQPSMGGLDQAGIAELADGILTKKFGSGSSKLSQQCLDMASNIFITGGNTKIPNLRERIVNEFTGFLPVNTPLNVNYAQNVSLDAWKGMAKFARSDTYSSTCVTKVEYEEFGPNYIKEHKLGNVRFVD
ncbi:actin-related protein ARP5 [Kluyveromyces lactis]|uniref:KLLA0F03421p n=1 Tax=Kluyveromyces lactis (strain ATCC 8585 / CBS 2359 / DSM 70799 / NBRC 1267 / NRRL Y-1140 / WM37) TaxID=284590 RepID=Q6CLF4_KLULA|nr:uncharacterized protein KLLA0_F03421g [Kluyveromyces lactis]CAG97943.1 KLLA0F03421p [Kluyveromyces lactis]|eukprot:XP_455235.1 uncharacterized protein KLLA0_F03421g [Kluyveromyces lactis]